jgi:hypothetical protein
VVRSHAQLLANPQEEAAFEQVARSHAPEVRIRMEHVSLSSGYKETFSIHPPQKQLADLTKVSRERPDDRLNLFDQRLRISRPEDNTQ